MKFFGVTIGSQHRAWSAEETCINCGTIVRVDSDTVVCVRSQLGKLLACKCPGCSMVNVLSKQTVPKVITYAAVRNSLKSDTPVETAVRS